MESSLGSVASSGIELIFEKTEDALDLFVLSLQVLLNLTCFVKNRVGIFVGCLCSFVSSARLNVLSHDDDGKQYQLQET